MKLPITIVAHFPNGGSVERSYHVGTVVRALNNMLKIAPEYFDGAPITRVEIRPYGAQHAMLSPETDGAI